ncbi:uncharacterized protein LOC115720232 [Cannabis sativa]|uniref:uncharacterized protein LOC115720232 n=1 Tax=Cannabis sativa TaxID=3483 RepID=UPI0029CA3B51|nr:uncharacterized protein LOC115720232 [Cannabis sativa]
MTSLWPFAMWGIDLIGALPIGRVVAKDTMVAINYYTKWVEVEALVHITAKQVVSFINNFFICRFGVPYKIITDNRTQFGGDLLSSYYFERGIERGLSAIVHPQANGQVEAANQIIKKNLKTKLENLKGRWGR